MNRPCLKIPQKKIARIIGFCDISQDRLPQIMEGRFIIEKSRKKNGCVVSIVIWAFVRHTVSRCLTFPALCSFPPVPTFGSI